MAFKINIGEKTGKTFKLESDSHSLIGKNIHDKIDGDLISKDLKGYEFQITGASDNAGFTTLDSVPGTSLKKVLLTYGKAMHKRPKREGKKKLTTPKPKGLRLRKTVRGKTISEKISQINLKVVKYGEKPLFETFPDQNKPKESTK